MIRWCCMFKSRRSTLVRRLWRLRSQNEAGGPAETTADDLEFKSVAHAMLKRLKEKQLEALIDSIESKGAEEGDCVLLPKGDNRLGKKTMSSLMLCCRLWRWPDLGNATEMKRLPCCKSENDPAYDCCNPFHWSLLTQPDLQITNIGLSEFIEKAKFTDDLDRPPEEAVSMETGMTPTTRRPDYTDDHIHKMDLENVDSYSNQTTTGGQHWCTLAYWELRERVGRLLTVFDSHTNIFQNLPHGDGLCLQILQQDNAASETVRRTREKIGLGITLSRETDGVYVYNRSEFPIFVHSRTLENPSLRTLYVHKVSSGFSVKIFDYERGHLMREMKYHDPKYLDGPYDPCSVRISFAKGWGPCYSRQFLFSCPCWLELFLKVDR